MRGCIWGESGLIVGCFEIDLFGRPYSFEVPNGKRDTALNHYSIERAVTSAEYYNILAGPSSMNCYSGVIGRFIPMSAK